MKRKFNLIKFCSKLLYFLNHWLHFNGIVKALSFIPSIFLANNFISTTSQFPFFLFPLFLQQSLNWKQTKTLKDSKWIKSYNLFPSWKLNIQIHRIQCFTFHCIYWIVILPLPTTTLYVMSFYMYYTGRCNTTHAKRVCTHIR